MRRKALLALTLTVPLGALAGCSSVRPFTTTAVSQAPDENFSYLGGRATRSFSNPPAAVQPAVLGAMEDLRVGAVRQWSEDATLVIEGTTADNRKAVVSLHPHADGSTRLTTRIGLFGDEPLSRALVDRVGIRLGTLPPTAIPVDPPSSPDGNPYFARDAVPNDVMLKDQADAHFKGSDAP